MPHLFAQKCEKMTNFFKKTLENHQNSVNLKKNEKCMVSWRESL